MTPPMEGTNARTQRLCLCGLVLLVALVAAILIHSLPSAIYTAKADDSYYLHYMSTIAERGPGAFPDLFAWRNESAERWIHPPPSRLAYVAVTAIAGKLFGATHATLSWVSLVAHLGTIVVGWLLVRRRLGAVFALGFAALLGFSPLLLGLGRLALMDTFTTLSLGLCLAAFFAFVENPTSRARTVAFAASLAWLVLVKELAVLVVVPFVVFLLIERYARHEPAPIARFFLASACAAIPVALLTIWAAGGLEPLLTTARTVLESPATNEYTLGYCAGPWYRYIVDFLLLSPATTLLGLFGFALVVARAMSGDYDRTHVLFAITGASTLFAQSFVLKNVRYATLLEYPLRALAVVTLAAFLPPRRRDAALLVTVAALCFLDWRSFVEIWEQNATYDPISGVLLTIREFLPKSVGR